jgi:hypothetical protein
MAAASVCSDKMAATGGKSFCVLEYHTSKTVVTVQCAFYAKYAKDPPTDKTIRAWCKQFTEAGCLCKQKSSGLLKSVCFVQSPDKKCTVQSSLLKKPLLA